MAKGHDMDKDADTITIRVIVFQDDGQWVAQCLEHDIGAQATDIDTLNDRLVTVLKAEFKESIERHGKPFAGIAPAPERFQVMWERRARSIEMTPAPWMLAANRAKLNMALVA
jgi:hypothetical protein